MNGTPNTTPPISEGIAGNLRITAVITKIGGNKNNRLISDSSLSDKLLIGEVLVVDGVKEVRPLYDEELYDIAADYYLLLKSAYLKEV